jgi:uncharacterized membrane protein
MQSEDLALPTLVICAFALIGCDVLKIGPAEPREVASESYFTDYVKPVLQKNCLRCHNAGFRTAGLDLSNRATAFMSRPGTKPLISPGRPDDSLLIEAVSRSGVHEKLMPRLDVSLTQDEIGMLREWIEDGAPWPAGISGQLTPVFNPENP